MKTITKKRTYSELILLPTFEERFKYCSLSGVIGVETFGGHRWLNQVLYTSNDWKAFARDIAIRDNGCEFALPGFEVYKYGTVHHLNPITKEDVINRAPCVFDPDNVVFVSSQTHKFLHYGSDQPPIMEPVIRKPNDTSPWRL